VSHVHVGRLIELDVNGSGAETKAEVEQMCERLLANPLIESYEVQPAPAEES
jgi:phosphoribosylformylglycinamidine synthase PurS subunit